jgi:hypothetical protein
VEENMVIGNHEEKDYETIRQKDGQIERLNIHLAQQNDFFDQPDG